MQFLCLSLGKLLSFVIFFAEHVCFQVLDGFGVVKSSSSVVTRLHHDGADIGQTDTFLTMVIVELTIDVIGVRIAQERLSLLLFSHLVLH